MQSSIIWEFLLKESGIKLCTFSLLGKGKRTSNPRLRNLIHVLNILEKRDTDMSDGWLCPKRRAPVLGELKPQRIKIVK